jgi:fructose-bisphosphate aldolase, class II
MWTTMKNMIEISGPGDFAIGSFHALNLEQIQGVLEAGFECQSPVIISLDEPTAMYAGIGAFMAMTMELAEEVPIPVSVQFDHVHDLDLIKQALSKGCTGILCDLRDMPLYRSIDNLSAIREMCEDAGAVLEIELIGTSHGDPDNLSKTFKILSQIGPDSICISVGPENKKGPDDKLLSLIENLVNSTSIAISLAGAGAWPEADLKEAISRGIWKISVGTRINKAFTQSLRGYLSANKEKIHPKSYLSPARDAFSAEICKCIDLFGSSKALQEKVMM